MNQKLMKSVPKLGIESNLVGYESKLYWIGIFGIWPSLINDIDDNDIQWMYLPQDCPAVTTLTDTIIHNSDASILIWPVKQTTGTITHYNKICWNCSNFFLLWVSKTILFFVLICHLCPICNGLPISYALNVCTWYYYYWLLLLTSNSNE